MYPLVHRVVYAVIRFGNHLGEMMTMGLQNRSRIICRSSVHHDMLYFGIGLIDNRGQSIFDGLCTIETDSDD